MCLRAPPTAFIFRPLAKFSLPLAKIYRVAPVFVFFKRLNVLQCVNKRNIMAELSQIKELLKTELTPIHAKLVVLEEKFEQLTNSYEFLSAKYNELLEQSKVTHTWAGGVLLPNSVTPVGLHCSPPGDSSIGNRTPPCPCV